MAENIIVLVRKGDGVVSGASVNILDSMNLLVDSGITDGAGTVTLCVQNTARYLANATFVDGLGSWAGSTSFTSDPVVPVNVEISLNLV